MIFVQSTTITAYTESCLDLFTQIIECQAVRQDCASLTLPLSSREPQIYTMSVNRNFAIVF